MGIVGKTIKEVASNVTSPRKGGLADVARAAVKLNRETKGVRLTDNSKGAQAIVSARGTVGKLKAEVAKRKAKYMSSSDGKVKR